jgi:alpha-mannosidase
MKIERLQVLLPCHTLENLEIERETVEAEQLLAAWTALYHPALIFAARSAPIWLSANMPSTEISNCLVVLPECCESWLPDDWLAEVESCEAVVLRKMSDRREIVAAALKQFDDPPPEIDPELVADFHALGYCHLMVELLTRKLRYMSNLDETAFRASVLEAADAAAQGDGLTARGRLQNAFDRLHDSREYFYPTEPRLLDLTLVASTTLNEPLCKELQAAVPLNLLLSGEVLEEMAAREPDSLAALKDGLSKKTAAIVGGEYAELPLPLLPPEAIAENLENGLTAYEKHLAYRPKIFGRRKFGLTPALPQILKWAGFTGTMHFTLDDGQFPTGNQSRVQWAGFDGETIEAIARIPVDASKADVFLALPRRLANCMDLDQAASQVFAHWPADVSPYYEDLRRTTSYANVLGKFCTIDAVFEQTQLSGQRVQYSADQYRSPYLFQDATGRRDPISRWAKYYRREYLIESIRTLDALSKLLSPKNSAETSSEKSASAVSLDLEPANEKAFDEKLNMLLDSAIKRFAESLRGEPSPSQAYSSAEKGYLLLNPFSFPQRQGVLLPELSQTLENSDAVRAADGKAAVVDLPNMGFVWIGDGSADAAAKPEPEKPLAEEHLLRNEHFELRFDPTTGAIRSVSDYRSRHPRLAQQIALRIPRDGIDPASDENYTIMAADEFQIISAGPVCGEILCRGRLMDRQGEQVADFSQTTRVWRGSRVVEIEIEIDPRRLPDDRPWNSYYACRFAWYDQQCEFFRGVNLANRPTEAVKLESPLFIDLRSGKLRTTILSAGLPYHRRIGPRKLDTPLIVAGETARKFRLGFALDVPNPTVAALSFIAPQLKLYGPLKPPAPSGWLFHLDHRNVMATAWLSLPLEEGRDNANENQNGFRVRLLETEGRSADLKLRCLRPVAAARKLEPAGHPSAELEVEGDAVRIPMSPHEWIDVAVQFET